MSITFKYRLFNICFTFGRESNSSATLSQLPPPPPLPDPNRVQECSHKTFVKRDSCSNLPPQPGDGTEIPLRGSPSQPMLKVENSCYSNQFSTCTELARSSLLIFSGFISSGRVAAPQVRAVLGSAGWRNAWKALRGRGSSPIRWLLLVNFA